MVLGGGHLHKVASAVLLLQLKIPLPPSKLHLRIFRVEICPTGVCGKPEIQSLIYAAHVSVARNPSGTDAGRMLGGDQAAGTFASLIVWVGPSKSEALFCPLNAIFRIRPYREPRFELPKNRNQFRNGLHFACSKLIDDRLESRALTASAHEGVKMI